MDEKSGASGHYWWNDSIKETYLGYPVCRASITAFSPFSYPTLSCHVGRDTLTAYVVIAGQYEKDIVCLCVEAGKTHMRGFFRNWISQRHINCLL